MSQLYNRKANFIFGEKGQLSTKITGLRIVFDVKKTGTSTTNKSKVHIYNMNEENRLLFSLFDDLHGILEVGYGDNVDQLSSGDIIKSKSVKKGPDWVTTVELSDGEKGLTQATLDKSYDAGSSYKTIVTDLVNELKATGQMAIGSLDKITDVLTQNGFTVSGKVKDVLDNITAKLGLDWSVMDDEIIFLDPDKSDGEEAVVLSPETGLLDAPIAREEGVEFNALIQTTRIRPGRLAQLKDALIEGNFRIRSTHFKGDTDGNVWTVNCVGIEE